jgi:hypothetical protein
MPLIKQPSSCKKTLRWIGRESNDAAREPKIQRVVGFDGYTYGCRLKRGGPYADFAGMHSPHRNMR